MNHPSPCSSCYLQPRIRDHMIVPRESEGHVFKFESKEDSSLETTVWWDDLWFILTLWCESQKSRNSLHCVFLFTTQKLSVPI